MSGHDEPSWVFPGSPEAERRRLEGEADRLRAAAHQLREHADALGPLLRRVQSFDRPDVWMGGVADRYRGAMIDLMRELTSPWAGAATGLYEAAARLDARAQAASTTAAGLVAVPLGDGPGDAPWPRPLTVRD